MNLVDELLMKADAWVERTGLSHARLATLAINDSKFFLRIKKGGSVTVRTGERFVQWIDGPGSQILPRSPDDRRTLRYRRRQEELQGQQQAQDV